MKLSRIGALVAAAHVFAMALAMPPARAADLNGAWASNQADCRNLFVKKGKTLSFRPQTALGGSGFIIDGNAIQGKIMKCAIKARREDGAMIHLRAACASDLMLSDVQFSSQIVDDNTIKRIFPGMDGVEHTFYRCSP